jgi:hypothetical protein
MRIYHVGKVMKLARLHIVMNSIRESAIEE